MYVNETWCKVSLNTCRSQVLIPVPCLLEKTALINTTRQKRRDRESSDRPELTFLTPAVSEDVMGVRPGFSGQALFCSQAVASHTCSVGTSGPPTGFTSFVQSSGQRGLSGKAPGFDVVLQDPSSRSISTAASARQSVESNAAAAIFASKLIATNSSIALSSAAFEVALVTTAGWCTLVAMHTLSTASCVFASASSRLFDAGLLTILLEVGMF
mmetsp:Transcript_161344/g.286043  ORF Transcript_161344/g.286043 Transcript_161344/m.286043 type:complete len:213 (+) Transcript_161344:2-640(+)